MLCVSAPEAVFWIGGGMRAVNLAICVGVLLTAGQVSGQQVSVEQINSTTDRYLRTAYMCRVATEPGVKPDFAGMDNIRVDSINVAYADLYGDGTLEFFSGASDEPFASTDWMYRNGNRERSRAAHQYMFFSPDPDFERPDGTRFLMARTIVVQDFNGDGIDDAAFIQHGPDYAPFEPRRSEVMLSGPDGYSVSYLPGPRSLWHGGAAGDIDGDGDVDLLATPGPNDEIAAYINDGLGGFTYGMLIGAGRHKSQNARHFNGLLWDIDGDGALDILSDGHEAQASVYWGRGDGSFEQQATVLGSAFDQVFTQDFEFADVDGDDTSELVTLVSRNTAGGDNYYNSWAIIAQSFDGREPSAANVLSEAEHEPRGGFNWLPKFTACDLQQDGDTDFVFEMHGERWWAAEFDRREALATDFGQIDKLVWLNTNGALDLFHVEHPRYFDSRYAAWLEQTAQALGVTVTGYAASVLNPIEFPDRALTGDTGRDTQFVWHDLMANDRPNLLRPLNDLGARGWYDELNRELVQLWN